MRAKLNAAWETTKTTAGTARTICFGSPTRTAITVGVSMLAMSAAKTIYDCATGDCNKTPEEMHHMLHIQWVATSVVVKIAENSGIRVVAPIAIGIFAGTMHAMKDTFCRKQATDAEQAVLINEQNRQGSGHL